VIAPLLFNIMVHDVDTAVKGKVVLTMYADDLAIWTDTHIRRLHTNSSWVKQSMKLFQEAVDGVVHFMQVNGFALSSQKTVFEKEKTTYRHRDDIIFQSTMPCTLLF